MSVVRNPDKKNFVVAIGVDEPNSSEPGKGLKEGGGEECVCGEEEDGSERAEGKGQFVFQYFVFVFLCLYWMSKVVSGTHWWCVRKSGCESHSWFANLG